jgi:hypothetical protein
MKKGLIFIIAIVVLVALSLYIYVKSTSQQLEINEIIEEETPEQIFIPETIEAAKARQILTLYEKIEINKLQDLKSENLCTITFNNQEILSNEEAKATYTFDESIIGKKIKLSCDQFERYGISEDNLFDSTIESSTEIDESISCDYGRVTTPTVYFWFISSDDLETDYCVAPLTVLPQEKDSGSCFSEEEIQAMKEECDSKDKPYFEIPDSNGCPTIYCGWQNAESLCPSESLLHASKTDCEAQGNTAVTYSEQSNSDFPCAQIRCSTCPTQEALDTETASCKNQGGSPEAQTDLDTGCQFIYCTAPEEFIA